jgi:NarL family two-component system response regulator LiaR
MSLLYFPLITGMRSTMRNDLDRLSPLEEEIAKRIIEGESTKEIADFFSVRPQVIRRHLMEIYSKLHVKNRLGMVILLTSDKADSA